MPATPPKHSKVLLFALVLISITAVVLVLGLRSDSLNVGLVYGGF